MAPWVCTSQVLQGHVPPSQGPDAMAMRQPEALDPSESRQSQLLHHLPRTRELRMNLVAHAHHLSQLDLWAESHRYPPSFVASLVDIQIHVP